MSLRHTHWMRETSYSQACTVCIADYMSVDDTPTGRPDTDSECTGPVASSHHPAKNSHFNMSAAQHI